MVLFVVWRGDVSGVGLRGLWDGDFRRILGF